MRCGPFQAVSTWRVRVIFSLKKWAASATLDRPGHPALPLGREGAGAQGGARAGGGEVLRSVGGGTLLAAAQAVARALRVEPALRSFDGVLDRPEMAVELDQLALGLRGGLEPLRREVLAARAVDPVELDGQAGQVLELRLVEAPQLAPAASQPDPLPDARRSVLRRAGGGGRLRRGLLGLRVQAGLLEGVLDRRFLDGRKRALRLDPGALERLDGFAGGEPAFLS